MNLKELVKDANTLKEVMQRAYKSNTWLRIYPISTKVNLEVLDAKEDYAVVVTRMRSGVIGKPQQLIHPYGSAIGYEIGNYDD